MNKLYYGDNLEVLKESIEDESIDLIYIDPPFNSKRAYNILFESIDLSDAKAQKEAFADTWSNVSYIDELNEIQDLNLDLFRFLKTLDSLNISKGAVSYLTIMAHRIWYMHKKLKQTGSFYLHCDPTMSHYLKIVMDLIFGVKNFRNELVWHYRRWTAGSKQFQRMHDIILFYSKSNNYYFKIPYEPYGNWIKKDYKYIDEKTGKRWRWHTVKGVKYKVILEDEDKGVKCNDVFQFPYIGSTSKERLGYPTQKPEQLLERIIEASSKKGDTVADFFCGCGTTIAIAQKLNRKWIGVDISHLAVRLIYNRLLKPFEESDEKYKEIINNIDINGFPKDIASAKDLAQKTK
ncbi:MAG: site-specific DNA-methyltransferase, partial [FCB group bacterium]|nr:site-specific DNA-methyltransferase [FCB group bacterium]